MKQEKTDAILLAAKFRFAKFGLAKTSIDEIARLARVAKGTIYNYFGSKDKVYLEVLQHESDELIAKILTDLSQVSLPLEKLKVFAKAKFYHLRNTLNILHSLNNYDIELLLPDIEIIRDKYLKKEFKIIRSILKAGIDEGVFFVTDLSLTTKAIGYALQGFVMHWLTKNNLSEAKIESYIEHTVQMLLWGIVKREKE